ncbi:TetR/AcrR family transcriptional regulator [Streptacidiphilus sp. P02-A3a]|uniref:TetR/AcrR family transcriptional regulator n=1 Tax=Streptacidiphilus sp. P02-A3a TaxID=2704468 RepID=UPI0015FBE284|nr:TetR/AcrR family transcriptional regulator [Streptacidiphilus sp. P02-A3a]QMU70510.1 TetR family transcriptional regulator [Streptacidiphilus sp. P02-A3a]
MAETRGTGRRERLRAETTAEIKSTALALMGSGGPDAITLRAIGREMGMTANAIYGYFATRDDLVTALITDVYTALADAVDAAWAAAPKTDPAAGIQAWAHAFRDWALANPEGFRLVYGDPVPGYRAPEGGAAPDAARRVCVGIAALAAASPRSVQPPTGEAAFTWDDFDPGLLAKVRPAFPDLPPAGVALALRLWGHLHGLVALEIYGHLRAQTLAPDKLFQAELAHLVRSLDLPRA